MSLVKYSNAELKQMFGSTLYTPELCFTVMEHMSEGLSLSSFCGRFLLSETTVKSWAIKYPDFNESIEIGKNLQRYTWEKVLIGQSLGEIKANPAAMIFALKNYFPNDFQDKRDVAITAAQIVVDTGIPHRSHNQEAIAHRAIEGEVVEAVIVEEEGENNLHKQSINSMFGVVEDEIDLL